jgi:hypothetical protein
MKRRSRMAGATLLASAMVFAPALVLAQTPCQVVGNLSVSGSKAYRNGQPLKKNAKDVPLCSGDEIRTESKTSAVVKTSSDQTVQTDENTTLFAKIGSSITQLLLWLRDGQAVVHGKDVGITTAELSADLGSTVNVRVDSSGSTLTVIEGHATVTRPTSVAAGANERYVASIDGAVQHYAISPDEARRSADWTKNYFNPGGNSFWKRAAAVVGIVIAGVVIHEATKGDDDDKSGQPPPPPAEPPAEVPQPPSDSSQPPTDSPQPPPLVQHPAHEVLHPAPVQVQQLQNCCIGGLNGTTLQLTPAQCRARGGDPGVVCTIVK